MKLFRCIFLSLALAGTSHADNPNQPAKLPMNGDTPDQQLLFTTTRIDAKSADGKKSSTGTGFVVMEKIDAQSQVLFIVTCRHVVEGFDSATLSFIADKDGKPKLGEKCIVDIADLPKNVFFNLDSKIDIAIIPLFPILKHFESQGKKPFFRALERNLIPSASTESELSTIQPILFIGYPSGIRDEANLLPITRRGITATPYSVDYNNLPLFLIDATVFGGSSGSPVMIFDTGGFETGGGFVIGRRAHFLGLISEAYFHDQEGEVQFRTLPSAAIPLYKQRTYLNLGVVIKARAVFETIDQFLKKFPPGK